MNDSRSIGSDQPRTTAAGDSILSPHHLKRDIDLTSLWVLLCSGRRVSFVATDAWWKMIAAEYSDRRRYHRNLEFIQSLYMALYDSCILPLQRSGFNGGSATLAAAAACGSRHLFVHVSTEQIEAMLWAIFFHGIVMRYQPPNAFENGGVGSSANTYDLLPDYNVDGDAVLTGTLVDVNASMQLWNAFYTSAVLGHTRQTGQDQYALTPVDDLFYHTVAQCILVQQKHPESLMRLIPRNFFTQQDKKLSLTPLTSCLSNAELLPLLFSDIILHHLGLPMEHYDVYRQRVWIEFKQFHRSHSKNFRRVARRVMNTSTDSASTDSVDAESCYYSSTRPALLRHWLSSANGNIYFFRYFDDKYRFQAHLSMSFELQTIGGDMRNILHTESDSFNGSDHEKVQPSVKSIAMPNVQQLMKIESLYFMHAKRAESYMRNIFMKCNNTTKDGVSSTERGIRQRRNMPTVDAQDQQQTGSLYPTSTQIEQMLTLNTGKICVYYRLKNSQRTAGLRTVSNDEDIVALFLGYVVDNPEHDIPPPSGYIGDLEKIKEEKQKQKTKRERDLIMLIAKKPHLQRLLPELLDPFYDENHSGKKENSRRLNWSPRSKLQTFDRHENTVSSGTNSVPRAAHDLDAEPRPLGGQLLLKFVGLHPKYRGTGLGNKIWAHYVYHLRNENPQLERVTCFVPNGRLKSRLMSLGFVVSSESKRRLHTNTSCSELSLTFQHIKMTRASEQSFCE